ncbi:MAG: nucleotidyltransferase family protein [Anaerolineales bacterium]|nr:nucleotidyltransferase family protein [Anaerolineales bacterium]
MKGMILAAGEGRRLRPLTDHVPKPMLPVAGRPLLEHTITYLRDCGVTDLAVNLYHLPQVVIDYFGDGSRWGVSLHYSVEEHLLGSAGGVKRLQSFFDDTFIVFYGDLLTWADLRPMIELHRRTGVLATMGLYHVPDPWNRGIVQLDEANNVVRFVEKPPRDQVFSNLANAGIYVLEPEVLNRIPAEQVYDFGHDVFPGLLADGIQVAGYVIEDFLIDIGLPEKYEEANRIMLRVG